MTPHPTRRSFLIGGTVSSLAACAPTERTPATSPSAPQETSPAAAPTLSASPRAVPETGMTDLFQRYWNSSGQWSGADSTYSVIMPDGSVAWLFSDTFFGPVNPDGSRPRETPFLHNSIVVQPKPGSPTLRTVHGTDRKGAPATAVPSTVPNTWNWLGAGTVSPEGLLQVTTLQMRKTGEGILDFAWSATGLARWTWAVARCGSAPTCRAARRGRGLGVLNRHTVESH